MTGPKISSRATTAVCATSSTVGATKKPFSSAGSVGSRPETATVPSVAPSRMYSETRCCWARLTTGPIVVAGVEARAQAEPPATVAEPVEHLAVDVGVHVDPGAGGADLALVGEHARRRCRRWRRQVGVGEDDVRRLAAELDADPLDGVRRTAQDQPAHGRRPGERHLVDARRAPTSAAPARAPPVTTWKTPSGQAGLGQQVRAAEASVSGVCSAGLSSTRAAGGERGCDLLHGQQQRVVPRA